MAEHKFLSDYDNSLIIDGLQYTKWDKEYFIFLREAGISMVHVTLVYHEMARETLSLFALWNHFFDTYSDLIMPVVEANDILIAKEQGKTGILFGAQNCSLIDDEIGLISVMRNLGLCIMQLTYNNQSLLATGCYEQQDSGITRFGRQAIKEMNRVGMIVDMSHSATQSTLQAIEISERPICISHANPYFVCPALRNKPDEVLKALFESGGMLGFSMYPFHLPSFDKCSLDQFCQMIADTAEKYGTTQIGIGSDLCRNQPLSVLEWMRNGRWSQEMNYGEGSSDNAGWPDPLPWFSDANGMKNVYCGLMDKGFSMSETQGILGKNWFNFLEEGLTKKNL